MADKISLNLVGANARSDRLLNILDAGSIDLTVNIRLGGDFARLEALLARPQVTVNANAPAGGGGGGGHPSGGGVGTAVGAAIGGGIGAAVGTLIENTLERAFETLGHAAEKLVDTFKEAVEAGKQYQESLLAVTASLQNNTVVSRNGAPVGLKESLDFNQQRGKQVLDASRARLNGIGVTGAAQSAIVSSVQSAGAARGFILGGETTANLGTRLASVAKVVSPDLLNNIPRLRKDIEDIIQGSPSAGRTVLGSSIKGTGILEDLKNAKTEADFNKAADKLKGFEDAITNSSLAIQNNAKIEAQQNAALTAFGTSYLDAVGPSLKGIADALKDAHLDESFGALGEAVGSAVGTLSDAFVPAIISVTGAVAGFAKGAYTGAKEHIGGLLGNIGTSASLVGGLFQGKSFDQTLADQDAKTEKDQNDKNQTTSKANLRNTIKGQLSGVGLEEATLDSATKKANEQSPDDQAAKVASILGNKFFAKDPEFAEQRPGLFNLQRDLQQKSFTEFQKSADFGGPNSANAAAKVGFQGIQASSFKGQLDENAAKAAANKESQGLLNNLPKIRLLGQGGLPGEDEEKAGGGLNIASLQEEANKLAKERVSLEKELAANAADTVKALDAQVTAQEAELDLKKKAVGGVGVDKALKQNAVEQAGLPGIIATRSAEVDKLTSALASADEKHKPIVQQELDNVKLRVQADQNRKADLEREAQVLTIRKGLQDVDTATIAGGLKAQLGGIQTAQISKEISPRVAGIQSDRATDQANLKTQTALVDVQRAQESLADSTYNYKRKQDELTQSLVLAQRAVQDFDAQLELSKLGDQDNLDALNKTITDLGGQAKGSATLSGIADTDPNTRKLKEAELKRDALLKKSDDASFGDDVFNRKETGAKVGDVKKSIEQNERTPRDAALAFATTMQNLETQLGTNAAGLKNFDGAIAEAVANLKEFAKTFGGDKIASKDPKDPKDATGTTKPMSDTEKLIAAMNKLAVTPETIASGVTQGFTNAFGGSP